MQTHRQLNVETCKSVDCPSRPGSSSHPFNVRFRLSPQLTLWSVAVGVRDMLKTVLVLLTLLLDLSQSRAEFRFVASVFITKLAVPHGQATQSGLVAAHSPFSWQNHSRSRAGSLLPLMRLFIYQISLWTSRGKNKPGIAEHMISISKTELLKILVRFCECNTSYLKCSWFTVLWFKAAAGVKRAHCCNLS